MEATSFVSNISNDTNALTSQRFDKAVINSFKQNRSTTSTAASRAAAAAASVSLPKLNSYKKELEIIYSAVNGESKNGLTKSLPLSEEEVTDSMMSLAVLEANRALGQSHFRLAYSLHDDTNQVMVKVMDANTDEILREIPPESKLDTLARILEFAGLIFDGRG